MKTAIIIHGMPSKEEYDAAPERSGEHWYPWLKKELEVKGFEVQTPEMPVPYDPNYEKWKSTFEQFHIDEDTVLSGHSCGGGFLLRWLSEHNTKVGQLILVAPWIDPTGELGQRNDFFDFEIDHNLVSKTVNGIIVFYSTDDDEVVLKSVDKIKATISDIKIREFTDKGHFTTGDGVSEFPELLEEIK